jgi:CheY-like chemotaxis protein
LHEADVAIIDGFRVDLERAAAERRRIEERAAADVAKIEAELVQLSTFVLRKDGFIHSGERHPLRPGVPPTSQEILMVEDDPSFLRAMGRLLKAHGFRVAEAATVAEAIEHVTGRARVGPRFDFVILDLALPDGSGVDVLKLVRQGASGTDVIVISGIVDETLLARAKKHGASKILVKPIDFDELLAMLGVDEGPPSSVEIPTVPEMTS